MSDNTQSAVFRLQKIDKKSQWPLDKHAQHYTRPILTSLLNSHCPSVLPVLGHVSLLERLCMVWTDMIALRGIFFRARRYVLIQEELRHSSSAANRQMWFGSQSSLLSAMRKVIELNQSENGSSYWYIWVKSFKPWLWVWTVWTLRIKSSIIIHHHPSRQELQLLASLTDKIRAMKRRDQNQGPNCSCFKKTQAQCSNFPIS